jgi:hypothetical protein
VREKGKKQERNCLAVPQAFLPVIKSFLRGAGWKPAPQMLSVYESLDD